MLKSLQFRNYRCFEDHRVPLAPLTILVGRNNAGKSTVAEALRLVSLVTRRYRNPSFRRPRAEFDLPVRSVGIEPSLDGVELDFDTLFHRYNEPPAEITAVFDDSSSIAITVIRDRIHACVRDQSGRLIESPAAARSVKLPRIAILPQISPLAKNERILNREYVLRNLDSRVSHLHFRNQLHFMQEEYMSALRESVEATWPGLRVQQLTTLDGGLSLTMRDRDFVAEVGAMGHGLQMWLQIVWFLVRESKSDVVILDEPDVYMHADLQRRLLWHVRKMFPQVLITTHSTEMMSEVEPENILVIDRDRPSSGFASSVQAVQSVLSRLGSIHNVGLARLWKASKLLLVEGNDVDILKRLYRALASQDGSSLDTIPSFAIGGWSGWSYAVGSALLLRNAAGEDVKVYCVLDSDYFPPNSIRSRLLDAPKKNVRLHIWSRKEVENFLLVPSAIQRVIASRAPQRVAPVSIPEIERKISEISLRLRDGVFDAMAHEVLAVQRSIGPSGANKIARAELARRESSSGLLSLVSGKEVLSQLSAWSQHEYGVSLSAISIAASMLRAEIPTEVAEVLRAIGQGSELPPSAWTNVP